MTNEPKSPTDEAPPMSNEPSSPPAGPRPRRSNPVVPPMRPAGPRRRSCSRESPGCSCYRRTTRSWLRDGPTVCTSGSPESPSLTDRPGGDRQKARAPVGRSGRGGRGAVAIRRGHADPLATPIGGGAAPAVVAAQARAGAAGPAGLGAGGDAPSPRSRSVPESIRGADDLSDRGHEPLQDPDRQGIFDIRQTHQGIRRRKPAPARS